MIPTGSKSTTKRETNSYGAEPYSNIIGRPPLGVGTKAIHYIIMCLLYLRVNVVGVMIIFSAERDQDNTLILYEAKERRPSRGGAVASDIATNLTATSPRGPSQLTCGRRHDEVFCEEPHQ